MTHGPGSWIPTRRVAGPALRDDPTCQDARSCFSLSSIPSPSIADARTARLVPTRRRWRWGRAPELNWNTFLQPADQQGRNCMVQSDLTTYFDELIQSRRREPEADLLSALLALADEGTSSRWTKSTRRHACCWWAVTRPVGCRKSVRGSRRLPRVFVQQAA